MSRDDFEKRLCRDSTKDQVQGLRGSLLVEAVGKGLADTEDRLVMRRKVGGGKMVKEKYAEDIWALTGAIQKKCESFSHLVVKWKAGERRLADQSDQDERSGKEEQREGCQR